jgi:hypothetical protein
MDKIGNWLRLWSGDDQLGVAADAPADAIMAGPGENVPPMYLRLNTYTDRTETVMREGRGSAFGPRLITGHWMDPATTTRPTPEA